MISEPILTGDWSNCVTIQPKASRMRWCPNCHELHDARCFLRFHGSTTGCMINKGSRSRAMAKIKGGAGSKK